MKDLSDIERRLKELGDRLHQDMIPTTDDEGGDAWVEGSGLHVALEIMKVERDVRQNEGRETTLDDFPPELQEQMRLWSNAKLTYEDAPVFKITKDLCQQILAEGHR